MTEETKVRQLETVPQRSSKEVKELLQEWLENDSIEEIIILGRGGTTYRWDHSRLSSSFWWIGFFKYIADILSDCQRET